MRVGFTGTREGMTDPQRRAFIAWATVAGATEFHHGCCIGADYDAWEVFASAGDLGFAKPRVVSHPPTDRSFLSSLAEMFAENCGPNTRAALALLGVPAPSEKTA
jgi:hypothetical protein